jgi:predicted TIM-barrel fold metal-dependent hydrolase
MTGSYVDTFMNMPPPVGEVPQRAPTLQRWFKDSKALFEGGTIDQLVAGMDAGGVEKALVTGRHGWSLPGTKPVGPIATSHGIDDADFDRFASEMAEATQRFPGRLYGAVMIDPNGAMRSMRQLERAVKDYGFVAARMMTSLNGIPLNDPLCYPIYTKCIELGIPLTVNIGVPGPLRPARTQRPMDLDDVLLVYPELKLVGTHIGDPWHREVVALLQKHENFYLITSGWAPKYIPEEILKFMNSRGSTKVMWASDYPVLSVERTVAEALALPLKDEVRQRYMRDNALAVFNMA